MIAFTQQLIRSEKNTEYETFELTLKGDLFTETFFCAFEHNTGLFIVKLASAPKTVTKKRRSGSHRTVSSGRICSQLATALCAYAEHFNASSLHIAVPKGHRENAAWMRSCLYVGLKLSNGAKNKTLLNGSDFVLLSLKFATSSAKQSPRDSASVGTDSTCEGWSPSHSDIASDLGGSDFFLDLNA